MTTITTSDKITETPKLQKRIDDNHVTKLIRLSRDMDRSSSYITRALKELLAHRRARETRQRRQSKTASEQQVVLSTPVQIIRFPARAYAAFTSLDIVTLNDLIDHTPQELAECRNFGSTTLDDIRAMLAMMGLHLKDDNNDCDNDGDDEHA